MAWARKDKGSAELATVAAISADGSIRWDNLPGNASLSAGTVLVPTERTLLKAVTFPAVSKRQRLAAATFALEDDLAVPLAEMHISLGPEISPRRHLLTAVNHADMQDWTSLVHGEGIKRPRLLPDALALQRPPEDQWAVWTDGDRFLVRTREAGFATTTVLAPLAWQISGCPPILLTGGDLPEPMAREATRQDAAVTTPDTVAARLDLLQGTYAIDGESVVRRLVQVAAVLVVGAAVDTGLLAYDVSRLNAIEDQLRADAITLIQTAAPSLANSPDSADTLLRLIPDAGAARVPGFLDSFTEAASVLDGHKDGLSISKIAYSASDGQLSMDVSASDLSALRRIEGAFADAGLNPTSGTANVVDGGAEARIIIQSFGAAQ